MTGGCRQKDWDTSKGHLGDTHIGRVERKREGWGARQRDRARRRKWSARAQKSRGTGKRKERQGEKGEGGEQERGREQKNSHRQNNRNTENKKLLPGSRTEAQSKRNKKPQGEGRVTHSTTLRE